MDGNWIKINRKMLDNPTVCHDPDYLAVWMYILLNAAYEEHDTWFGGKRITLKPGQFVTGADKVSEFWDISESKVRRILKRFKNDGQIDEQTNSRGRLITVINWNLYQKSDGQSDGQVTDKWRTSDGQVTPTKERKEREERKEESSSSLHSEEAAPSAYDDIAEAWNTLPEPVAKVSRITKGSQREKKLHRRILDHGRDKVLEAIDNIRCSTFLMGGGSKGWTITFDWFISPENFTKVLEGNYNDKVPPDVQEEDAWDRLWRAVDENPDRSQGHYTASGW